MRFIYKTAFGNAPNGVKLAYIEISAYVKYRNSQETNNQLSNKRIRLVEMTDDPNPIESGTEGTILYVDDLGTIHVQWDNGWTLGVIKGVDKYRIL